MRRFLKWTGVILLTPVILFVILLVLLYLPPIQDFCVGRVASYASEKTGMHIEIGRLTLLFPIDLVVKEVEIISDKDTLLSVDRLQVNVQLLPLFRKEVEIDGIELKGVKVNSKDLIKGMTIKGTLGEFYLESHGVDLSSEEVIIEEARLKDTQVNLVFNDSVKTPSDSVSEPVRWKFALHKLALANVSFSMQTPGDSITLYTKVKDALLKDGHVDLEREAYRLKSLHIENTIFRFDTGNSEIKKGFDPSHILLRDINIQLDSAEYSKENMAAIIRKVSARERSGLEILSLQGSGYTDSLGINVPSLWLETPYSRVNLSAKVGWSALMSSIDKGELSADLSASFGKQDILLFTGSLADDFSRTYPMRPLMLNVRFWGNMESLRLNELSCSLPGAFDLKASGEASNLLDSLTRSGEIEFDMQTGRMNFLLSLLEPSLRQRLAIPSGIKLDGKGMMSKGSRYHADLFLTKAEGSIGVKGMFDSKTQNYEADLIIKELQLNDFLPKDSLDELSASLTAKGKGFDLFSVHTLFSADVSIHGFKYGRYDFADLHMNASLARSLGSLTLTSVNPLLALQVKAETEVSRRSIKANVDMDVSNVDLYALHLTRHPFSASLNLKMEAETNLKDMYKLKGGVNELHLVFPKKKIESKNILVEAYTGKDSTFAEISSGDMDILLRADGGWENILNQLMGYSAELMKQITEKKIEQKVLRELLPTANLDITIGKDNPLSNYLSMSTDYGFDDFSLNINVSSVKGINGRMSLYSLRTDSLQIDTTRFFIRQDTSGMKLVANVVNVPGNPQFVFDATAEGAVYDDHVELLLKYLNEKGETGLLLGVRASLEQNGINFRLFPEKPIVAFRPFALNENNYIFLGNDKRVKADVDLFDQAGTGVRIYSLDNPDALQDIALELRRIDIGEIVGMLPYAPSIGGMLAGEAHYVQTETSLELAADLKVDSLEYEKKRIGDIALGAVYLPGENKKHHLDAYLSHNGKEVATVGGIFHGDGSNLLDTKAVLEHFPLTIANGFIPGEYARLAGEVDGELTVKGEVNQPRINGKIKLDSVSVFVSQANAYFRFDEEPIPIVDNRLVFDQFDIYTQGKNPFTINGELDFSNFSEITANVKLNAENYELLNAPRTKESLVYGKVFVNLDASLHGPLDELIMRGNMKLQGTTDMTYVLKDSPLTVQDRLGDLVTFVNFNDTTQWAQQDAPLLSLGGLDMLMTIEIDPAVKLKVDLSADRESRVELEGGGDLSLQYTPQGDLMLSGRYTLVSGLLKYSLSFISKTFTIQNGSYVDWTGNVINPTLNLTALVRNRTSVSQDNQAPRMVAFDMSISIKNRLNNLDLSFNLEAPEDATVQNQLSAMDAEERGKLAVTMLATGLYLGGGNAIGGGGNNAVNSFLQQQIASLAGSALGKIDVSVGIESNNGAGEQGKQTDLSFRFSRRYFNNRLSVIIGGKISTGESAQNTAQSFIDNVALEWRLDNSGTRYIKLFHDKNYESVLEGEIAETGIGVVLRKKMSRLKQLFIFRKPKNELKTKVENEK